MSTVKTTKSWKTNRRDRMKHSAGGRGSRKSGGGSHSWGKDGDEYFYGPVEDDKNDPNYDPNEHEAPVFTLTRQASDQFASTVKDLNTFKKGVRAAVTELIASGDVGEFVQCIKDLDSPIYHTTLTTIIIKQSISEDQDVQERVAAAITELHRQEMISRTQATAGFTKLYSQLDDLALDNPKAREVVNYFANQAILHQYLDAKDAEQIQDGADLVSDSKTVSIVKKEFREFASEFFANPGTEEETFDNLRSLNDAAPALYFQLVKIMIRKALDETDIERELASQFLAAAAGNVIPLDQVEKGVSLLLERLEDIYLDVPDILRLMTSFIARLVSDEALAPAFLVRVDLADWDMGMQVCTQAQQLLAVAKASIYLANIWGAEDRAADEDEQIEGNLSERLAEQEISDAKVDGGDDK